MPTADTQAAPAAPQPPLETLTLAGGCFWCVEAAVLALEGVLEATSGYAQGHIERPRYEQVCSGRSGHAEAVRVRFDPRVLSLERLLDVFFTIHDPTTRDRQGADVGPQYRSGIYHEHPGHEQRIAQYLEQMGREGRFGAQPIVTEVEPLRVFWPAEDEHQRYFERHPGQGYCQVVIAPKMARLRQRFSAQLTSDARS